MANQEKSAFLCEICRKPFSKTIKKTLLFENAKQVRCLFPQKLAGKL